MRTLSIKVKPNARTSRLEPEGENWIAHVKAPPIDGKANTELIALIAERFGCRKAQVSIKAGAGGRVKRVRIDD